MTDPVTFSRDDAKRVADATRKVERGEISTGEPRRRLIPGRATKTLAVVKQLVIDEEQTTVIQCYDPDDETQTTFPVTKPEGVDDYIASRTLANGNVEKIVPPYTEGGLLTAYSSDDGSTWVDLNVDRRKSLTQCNKYEPS